ncbi:conserved hypothetical protein [Mesorhizobium prunaredense]|uniref:Uncharacterized protein n=1 Tax=Mesorhizobium prunaredense TaxID=1631249 RepID=A0A1R3UYV6_9HYPH|nr:hypothetical protein [Mesorhizobium prunaredense]SIT52825.1 conserved hypothetical protein [Mesorhizobium prunaredense]
MKKFLRNHRRLRNRLASAPLLESLEVIHAYMVFFQFGTPLPAWIKPIENFETRDKIELGLFEWELDILCRELLRYASRWGTRNFAHWDGLADAINHMKEIHGDVQNAYSDILDTKIMSEVFRIQNQQFPWQTKPSSRWLVRYLKIFGMKELDEMIVQKVGLPIEKILRIGMAFFAIYMKNFSQSIPIKVDNNFATAEEMSTFVMHFSSQFWNLFEEAESTGSMGEDFIYVRNPLVVKPLILHDLNGSVELVCPVPNYLIRRVSEGLYYEICALPNFSEFFGPAFQSYVGEMFEAANRAGTFGITPEVTYISGGSPKHTIDWIVSDKTAHLFVECKTKRITYLAKTKILDSYSLDADVKEFGKAVAQTYKSLQAALDGEHPLWKNDNTPIYPIVVMLEDFYAVGLYEPIRKVAVENLEKSGIDTKLMEQYPFTLTSVWDLELAVLIMSDVGIETFMGKKVDGESKEWDLQVYTMNNFKDKLRGLNGSLFPKEMDRIFSGLAETKSDEAVANS